jgi:50S ribosomal protein L16 3-hydroxylase
VIEHLPGGMDATEFLQRYWQKQACLFRQASSGFQSFLSKQELFALACEEEVESRLVLEAGGDYPWQVIHGPFNERDFVGLPASHWSLLVQHTDLHLPAAAAFLKQFRFIPNWRIDDLMISYAPEHGSVGPHLDSYDVFLFQALGKRRWSINTHEYREDDFVDGLDLQIINDFQTEQEWLLEPGDMLYLPPGVAHHGIALEECMTYSIGFRAPSSHELVSHYVDDLLVSKSDQRYSDPNLSLAEHGGEIGKEDLGRIRSLFQSTLPDEIELTHWFGRFVTRLPENCEPEPALRQLNTASFLAAFQGKASLVKSPASRSAFSRSDNHFVLFVNGEAYTLSADIEAFVYTFTENDEFENPLLAQDMREPELADLLCQLYNNGIIIDKAKGNL